MKEGTLYITDTPAEAYARLQGIVALKPEGHGYTNAPGERLASYFHNDGSGCFVGEYFKALGYTKALLMLEFPEKDANNVSLGCLVRSGAVQFRHQETYKLLRRVQRLQDARTRLLAFNSERTPTYPWSRVLELVQLEGLVPDLAPVPQPETVQTQEGAAKPVSTLISEAFVHVSKTFDAMIACLGAVPDEEPAASEPSETEEAKELVAA